MLIIKKITNTIIGICDEDKFIKPSTPIDISVNNEIKIALNIENGIVRERKLPSSRLRSRCLGSVIHSSIGSVIINIFSRVILRAERG